MNFQEEKEFQEQYFIDGQPTQHFVEDPASLIHEAKNFKILLDAFKKQSFLSRPYYYILSAKWLKRWKIYVSYDSSISAAPPHKYFGRGTLPKINENILEKISKTSTSFNQEFQHLNTALKQGLLQEKDYIFVSQQIWQLFKKYDHIEIKRFVVQTQDGKKIEVYFQQISFIPIFAELLRQIERQKCSKLTTLTLQISHYISISEAQKLVRLKLKDFISAIPMVQFQTNFPVRMFLLPDDTQTNILANMLLTGCKANPTFIYKLFIDATFMDQEKNVSDFDILPNSLILVEMKQSKSNWIFWNIKTPYRGQCGHCKSVTELKFFCSCKFALYCKKTCKAYDKSHHKFRCPNDCQSEEQEVELKFTDYSRYGLTGLRNLGNTCFMNSGIQCLSHIIELTNYFLEDKYINEINKDNKLGTKGELSTAYAKLIKCLWMGTDSSVAPTTLKRAIGKYQPMFMGYNQHDSGELVSYLLDGVHEDLNRVKVKPYTETKQYNGGHDFDVAKQAWQTYLKRNDSIITDLMFGQFKSIVDCPKCNYESIQFDPFLICSLPIVNDNLKKIQVIFIEDHIYMTNITICYDAQWHWKVEDLLLDIKKKMQLGSDEQLVIYATSYSVTQAISPKQSLSFIQEEYKYRNLYVRLKLAEQDLELGVPVMVSNVVCSSYYGNEDYRRNIIPSRLYYFSRTLTLKQIHHFLFSYYKMVSQITNYEEEVINVEAKQQPMRILVIPSSRFYKCQYCQKKSCDGCNLKYSDTQTLESLCCDGKKKIQIQIYWRKNSKQVEKKFQQKKSNQQQTDDLQKKNKKKSGTTIHQCFRLFEEPEILGEQNAWYCPKCTEFVLAKKQMQIYKAPKILILCLKRFKRKQYYAEKFNIMVDYPLTDFDISEYVINHNLPQKYFKNQVKDQQKQKSLIYDLIGITNHFGGTGGGHYTAYCLDPKTKQWFDFDDSSVDELRSRENAITDSAYMLYYRRRE